MRNKQFEQFLDQAVSSSQMAQIDWEEKKREWIIFLGDLYEVIEGFLKPYIDKGKIMMTYSQVEINEELIGSYQVKSATILIGANRILLQPIGTNLIAAKGRVDMKGPYGTVKFVLVPQAADTPQIRTIIGTPGQFPEGPVGSIAETSIDWEWKIATQAPRIRYLPLDRDAFFDALMEVTNATPTDQDEQ